MGTYGAEFINIRDTDLAAVGDGIADDRPAIEAAIERIREAVGEGTIYFPPGRYRLLATGGTLLRVPREIALELAQGAVLLPDGALTVEIAGALRAGLHQIFASSTAGFTYGRFRFVGARIPALHP
jgi:hypothetical protein